MNEMYRFIEVQYQGSVNTLEVDRALSTRARLANEHDICDHLIECSQVEELPSLPDLYQVAESIGKVINFPIKKVALVLPKSENNGMKLLYFIMKARHHGIWIEIFTDRNNAVDWLN